MQLNPVLRFFTKERLWLCFKHVVFLAMQGIDVEVDIDDYSSDYYCGEDTVCSLCTEEKNSGDSSSQIFRRG